MLLESDSCTYSTHKHDNNNSNNNTLQSMDIVVVVCNVMLVNLRHIS